MKTASERITSIGNFRLRRAIAASRAATARVMDFLGSFCGGGQTRRQRLAVFGLAEPRKLQPVRIRR